MSSEEVIGLPCSQMVNGCVGKMRRGECKKEGVNLGRAFLSCEDMNWHSANPDYKGTFLWVNQKNDIDLYIRKAKAGFAAAPPPAKPAAASASKPAEKRAYTETVDDQGCRATLIDVNIKLKELIAVQKETLEFFKTEFKKAKKSSDEGEQIPNDEDCVNE